MVVLASQDAPLISSALETLPETQFREKDHLLGLAQNHLTGRKAKIVRQFQNDLDLSFFLVGASVKKIPIGLTYRVQIGSMSQTFLGILQIGSVICFFSPKDRVLCHGVRALEAWDCWGQFPS